MGIDSLQLEIESVRSWSKRVIRSLWELSQPHEEDQMKDNRNELITLCAEMPGVDDDFDRMLVLATTRCPRTNVPDVPMKAFGRHAPEVVRRTGLIALRCLHRGCLRHIRAQLKTFEEPLAGPPPKNSEWSRWQDDLANLVGAIAHEDNVLDQRFRPVLDRAYEYGPLGLWALPGSSLPVDVPSPGGELEVWIDKVLAAAYAAQQEMGQDTNPTEANVGAGSTLNKQKRSRKSPNDKDEDAKIASQWEQCRDQLRTYRAFARDIGKTERDVKRAIDRHRKRQQPRN